jgi:hypothetical protein
MDFNRTSQVETPLEEKHAHSNTTYHSGKSDYTVEVSSGYPEQHPDGAAEENESSYHYESTEKEADDGRRAAAGTPFAESESRNHCTQEETDYFRSYILHHSGTMEPYGSGDITHKTCDTDTHIRWVSPVDHQGSQDTEYYTCAYDCIFRFKIP